MRQRQPGRCANIRCGDVAATMPGGMSSRRRAVTMSARMPSTSKAAHPGNGRQFLIIEAYRRQERSGRGDSDAQRLFVGCVCGDEGCRVAVECHSSADHLLEASDRAGR